MHCLSALFSEHPSSVTRLTELINVSPSRASKILKHLEERELAVAVHAVDDAGRFGALDIESGRIRGFREKVRRFREVDDDFHDALGNAPRAAAMLGSDRLLVYGIYDVTGQQLEVSVKDVDESTLLINMVHSVQGIVLIKMLFGDNQKVAKVFFQ